LLFAQNGRFDEAEKIQRQLIKQDEASVSQDPSDLALKYRHLAVLLAATGRSEDAKQNFHKAIDLQKKLLAQSPTNADHRYHLATSHHYLANLLRDTGPSTAAEEPYLEALTHQEPLTALFPRNRGLPIRAGPHSK
jgi:tetratricopeptide (TPR) repeat protein